MSSAPVATRSGVEPRTPAARVTLRQHHARSRTTIHGWPAVCFGVPFLGAGVLMLLIWRGIIPVQPGSVNGPMWLMGAMGAVFGLPGLWLIWHGLEGVRARQRSQQAVLLHPNEPWKADHPWDPDGAADDGGRGIVSHVLGLSYMALFLSPFHWWAIRAGGGWFVGTIVGFFDLVLLLILGQMIYRLVQRAKYGRSYLRYGAFPYFAGEMLEAVLDCPRGLGGFERIQFALRCIEEAYEERGTGEDRRTEVVCHQRYRDTFEVDEPGEHRGSSGVPVTFLLPDDAPSTVLAARPPRYWEVEVHASTAGVDFKASFLVPVYRKG